MVPELSPETSEQLENRGNGRYRVLVDKADPQSPLYIESVDEVNIQSRIHKKLSDHLGLQQPVGGYMGVDYGKTTTEKRVWGLVGSSTSVDPITADQLEEAIKRGLVIIAPK